MEEDYVNFGGLLQKVPVDYDVRKIGFILIDDESQNEDDSMDSDLSPGTQKELHSNQCPICERKFMNRSNAQRHLKTVHSGHEYQCKICSMKFLDRRKYFYHGRAHQKGKLLICDLCGKSEKTAKDLIQHMEIHQGLLDIDIDLLLGRNIV